MSETQSHYITRNLTKPIVLIGMMGAGKTHIGSMLARELELDFYDTDRLIETKAGMPVADIFDMFGEPKFRDSEHKTIADLLKSKGPCVIATGGGAVTNAKTLEILKRDSLTIWLDMDLETLWERVQRSKTRPLLYADAPKEKLETLLNTRRPLYEQAHIHFQLKNDDRPPINQVLSAIADWF